MSDNNKLSRVGFIKMKFAVMKRAILSMFVQVLNSLQ